MLLIKLYCRLLATQHSSLRKGWSRILRRPQSKFVYNLSSTTVWGWNDYATCSLSREIIQDAMPLILSNGKKRAKIFPTNIWKKENIYMVFNFLVISSNPKYIININIQFFMLLRNEKFASCACLGWFYALFDTLYIIN